jgi:hypothetical protein
MGLSGPLVFAGRLKFGPYERKHIARTAEVSTKERTDILINGQIWYESRVQGQVTSHFFLGKINPSLFIRH